VRLLPVLALSIAAAQSEAITLHLGEAPAELELDVNDLSTGQKADVVQLQEFAFSGLFDGQTSGQTGTAAQGGPFETMSGQPTYSGDPGFPLELGAQGIDRNTIVDDLRAYLPALQTLVLGGLLDDPTVATGAISFLFDEDVLIFGMGIIGMNTPGKPGSEPGLDAQPSLFRFFDKRGNLVASREGPAEDGLFWFEIPRDADVRGVTVTTTDYRGVGYYDFRFAMPIPATLFLCMLGLGIGGLLRSTGRDRRHRPGPPPARR